VARSRKSNAGRSTTGEPAVPYYVEAPVREVAKHLRRTAARFLSERASVREVDEAFKIWQEVTKKSGPGKCDPERACAAAEVLEAVWLHERKFELEHTIEDPPVAEVDDAGQVWVTVKVHVPALDIDMWAEGTHCDHPENQKPASR